MLQEKKTTSRKKGISKKEKKINNQKKKKDLKNEVLEDTEWMNILQSCEIVEEKQLEIQNESKISHSLAQRQLLKFFLKKDKSKIKYFQNNFPIKKRKIINFLKFKNNSILTKIEKANLLSFLINEIVRQKDINHEI